MEKPKKPIGWVIFLGLISLPLIFGNLESYAQYAGVIIYPGFLGLVLIILSIVKIAKYTTASREYDDAQIAEQRAMAADNDTKVEVEEPTPNEPEHEAVQPEVAEPEIVQEKAPEAQEPKPQKRRLTVPVIAGFVLLVAVCAVLVVQNVQLTKETQRQKQEIYNLTIRTDELNARMSYLQQDAKLYKFNNETMRNENIYLREQVEALSTKLNEELGIYPSTKVKSGRDLGLYAGKTVAELREGITNSGVKGTPGIQQSNVEEWKRAYNK